MKVEILILALVILCSCGRPQEDKPKSKSEEVQEERYQEIESLTDKSLKFALLVFEDNEIYVDSIIYRPGKFDGLLVDVIYKNESVIDQDFLIKKGDTVTLVSEKRGQ